MSQSDSSSSQKPTFGSLDDFTKGFIEALLFVNSGDPEDELHGVGLGAVVEKMDALTLEAIIKNCADFQAAHTGDLALAYARDQYTPAKAGRDLLLSQSGATAGFLESDLGEPGDRLEDAAGKMPGIEIYKGDDGVIYWGGKEPPLSAGAIAP